MPRAGIKVKILDKQAHKTVEAVFGKAASSVTIGVFGDAAEEQAEGANITVAELAAIHEFGLGNMPERSFIRSYFDGNGPELGQLLMRLMTQAVKRAVTTGKPITDVIKRDILSKIGLRAVADIQERISAGEITPPLLPATIARKGSSVPLIDTGQLRSAITFEVEL